MHCRGEDDYLFREELEAFKSDGVLTSLRVAFSRKTPGKKEYVQHLMTEDGASLVKLLMADGAHVFVCGDGARMAKDVHACLEGVLCQHGGMVSSGATQYLNRLAKEGRYVRDIWS